MKFEFNPEFIYSEEENGDLVIVSLAQDSNEIIRLQGKLVDIFISIVEKGNDLADLKKTVGKDEAQDLERFVQQLLSLGILSDAQ